MQKLSDSPAMRWTALVLLASAMFFAYIFVDVLSPLQGLLQTQRGWDPDAYGHFAGSEPFLNVFVFFLIFAGIILDKMGVRFTAVLYGVVMAWRSHQLVCRHRPLRCVFSKDLHGQHTQSAASMVERHTLV